jgi:hypothetical protein
MSNASHDATRIYLDVLDSLLGATHKQMKMSVCYDLMQPQSVTNELTMPKLAMKKQYQSFGFIFKKETLYNDSERDIYR